MEVVTKKTKDGYVKVAGYYHHMPGFHYGDIISKNVIMTKETLQKIGEWLSDGNNNISSRYLCSIALGAKPKRIYYPYDGYNLEHCLKFLSIFSEKEKFKILGDAAAQSVKWSIIVINWAELMTIYDDSTAAPEYRKYDLYKFMKSIGL